MGTFESAALAKRLLALAVAATGFVALSVAGFSCTGGDVVFDAAKSSLSSGGGSGVICTSTPDCPLPANACIVATCNAGLCGTEFAPVGTVVAKDMPADCHATICDGEGHAMILVDTTNVPAPASPCIVGTCDAMGTEGQTLAAAGFPCTTPGGGKLCDGAGSCVGCLDIDDCPAGNACIGMSCVPSLCADGSKDGSETGIDCGGGACPACGIGVACLENSDCISNACDPGSSSCVASACSDKQEDGNETDVDCGGSCPPCAIDSKCKQGSDCASNACDALLHTCVADACEDQQTDGSETDVDCGGPICAPCAVMKNCDVGSDCVSHSCDPPSHTCVPNPCADNMKDGSESDVDCGGAICPGCANAKACFADKDCVSNVCDPGSHTCIANSCDNHLLDGNETAVDCGGICPPCALHEACLVDQDCVTNACDAIAQLCVANSCKDNQEDGLETDVDCGGGVCTTCANGAKCKVSPDCKSSGCDANLHICDPNACADKQTDNDETDVDCGGGSCLGCNVGMKCKTNFDCVSGHFCSVNKVCV